MFGKVLKKSAAVTAALLVIAAAGNVSAFGEGTGETQRLETKYEDLWTSDDITVTAGTPVEWYVIVPEGTEPKGCRATIKIPGLGWGTDSRNKEEGHLTLVEGENLVYTFTPEEAEDILFTCWMGSGCHANYIHVIEDDSPSEEDSSAPDESPEAEDTSSEDSSEADPETDSEEPESSLTDDSTSSAPAADTDNDSLSSEGADGTASEVSSSSSGSGSGGSGKNGNGGAGGSTSGSDSNPQTGAGIAGWLLALGALTGAGAFAAARKSGRTE